MTDVSVPCSMSSCHIHISHIIQTVVVVVVDVEQNRLAGDGLKEDILGDLELGVHARLPSCKSMADREDATLFGCRLILA